VTYPDPIKHKRIVSGICILILVPLGFLAKEYHGTGEYIISDKLAGTLYVMFWSILFYFFFYRINTIILVLSVFIITCSFEFLQLVSTPLLNTLRLGYIGRAIMGNSFSWSDFIFYVLGSIISYFIICKINKLSEK